MRRCSCPALVDELNGTYTSPKGKKFRRLAAVAFNLEDPAQLKTFLKGETRTITVPGSKQKVKYDPLRASASACRAWGPAKPWPSARTPLRCASWTGNKPHRAAECGFPWLMLPVCRLAAAFQIGLHVVMAAGEVKGKRPFPSFEYQPQT